MSELSGVAAVWRREFIVFKREVSRVISSIVSPLMWLLLFGSGLSGAVTVSGTDYQTFIFPGIVIMSVLFTSIFYGVYIIWDRKIDVLKAVLVAPVSRVAIVLGRTLGGVTTAVLQGVLFIVVAIPAGLKVPGFSGFFLTVFFMIFIAGAFVNLGLSIASLMRDMQGFSIVMNFIMVPLLLLSGAMFPVEQFPAWVRALCYINPLFYGVDGLRYSLIGMSKFSPLIDAAVLFSFCSFMVGLGAFLFSRSDVD